MNLHIETSGSGRDLVLLHGWGMHGGVWGPVQASLARHFRLHVLDMPGFGYSADAMLSPYTMQSLVARMAQLLPAKILLCGWSLGGQVALQWALQYPEQIQKLALVSSTPRFLNTQGWGFGIDRDVFNQFADDIQTDYQPAMTRFLTLQAQGSDDGRKTARELKQQFFRRPAPSPAALANGLALLQSNDLREAVGSIATPTLVMHGGRDKVAPVAAGRWLAERMNSALELQQNAAHAPFLSHPGWFADKLVEHMP